ncbi:MAG: hypothetical protein HUJ68_02140 [Clostridia bacterium]|nr:hypothetical protein [Clostridia bacterium]
MTYKFKISEKFPVTLQMARRYYRYLETAGNQEFWKENADGYQYRNKRGCYIFCIGNTPIYVGKAVGKNGFFQECFQQDKLNKLESFFQNYVDYQRNHLKIFFIYRDSQREPKIAGKDFCRRVKEMESFLIKLANRKNPDCKNDKETREHWEIEGFIPRIDHRRTMINEIESLLF